MGSGYVQPANEQTITLVGWLFVTPSGGGKHNSANGRQISVPEVPPL
jgi:hypothetical protein